MITIIKPEKPVQLNKNSSRDICVVTHDGLFHSDEVFSIALLNLFHKNIDIIRTRDTEILYEALNNPSVFVLDVGGIYNPQKRNFDHHQEGSPEGLSTISIVFQYLFPDYSNDAKMLKVYKRLIGGINDWDLGKVNRNTSNNQMYLPQLITAFNRNGSPDQDYQFIKAIEFAVQVIANDMNTAKEMLQSEDVWNKRKILSEDTAFLDQHCMFWRIIQGEKQNIKYIIQPSGSNWSVVSVDSKNYPLPSSSPEDHVVFEHKDGFIILFKTLSYALQYASSTILNNNAIASNKTKRNYPLNMDKC